GSQDVFISKLDANGNFVWAKRIGGTSSDFGNAIAIDGVGNVYTTGRFSDVVDFDPGTGTFNLNGGYGYYFDVFVSKLNVNGEFVWAKRIGGNGVDVGHAITLDGNNNVYTTGFFTGTVDFDPGTGTHNLASTGANDIFISKLDVNGNFLWANKFG